MTEKPLGDRLTAAKLIIDALAASQVDAEQAERLLDALIPPTNPQLGYATGGNVRENADLRLRSQNSTLSDLDAVDAREQAERAPIPADERQEAIDAELERMANQPNPNPPGESLLDNPESFVAKVSQAKLQRLEMGTKHR